MAQAWKAVKRRRCQLETCDSLYWPSQKHQRFCTQAHRLEYHQKTPTFRKFEEEIVKLMVKMLKPGCFK